MKAADSPYYPPRAGLGRYFFKICDVLRLAIQRTQLATDHDIAPAPAGFLRDCLVPGYGFRLAGWDQAARIAFSCWIVAFLAYFIFIGRGVGTLAFGVMMSIHATSVVCAISRVWPQRLLGIRLLIALTTALALYVTVYGPALGALQRSFIMPIWSHGGLYVINRTPWGQELERGDLVAYRIHVERGYIRVQDGTGIDRILGLPGEIVEFTKTSVRINGQEHPREPDMPTSGRIALAPDTWFVWPTVSTTLHGNAPPSWASRGKVALGKISQEEILGKPIGLRIWRTRNH
ncbi:MAG: S26 family signal peptidase [Chthoniobacteraceae bacterium]